MLGAQVVGTVTSGGYGHRTGKNLAYAFLDSAAERTDLEIDVLGTRVAARVVARALYDPEMALVRA